MTSRTLLLMAESGCADVGHSTGEPRIREKTITSGSTRKGNRDPRGAAEGWRGRSEGGKGRRGGGINMKGIG